MMNKLDASTPAISASRRLAANNTSAIPGAHEAQQGSSEPDPWGDLNQWLSANGIQKVPSPDIGAGGSVPGAEATVRPWQDYVRGKDDLHSLCVAFGVPAFEEGLREHAKVGQGLLSEVGKQGMCAHV